MECDLRRLLHSDLRGLRHYLYREVPAKTLLFWGTLVAIPQMVPLLFIRSAIGALIVAVPIGLMGGVATAAYLDLLIRSCPRGLQGTMQMMSAALYAIVQGLGNVLGTNLYDHFGGFTVCAVAITIVYALILPGPAVGAETADRHRGWADAPRSPSQRGNPDC